MDNGYLSIYLSITTFKHYISGMTPWFGCCTAACSMTAGCVLLLQLLQHCTALQWAALDPAKHLHSRSRFKMETFTEVHHIIDALQLLLKRHKFAEPWTNGFLG